MTASSQAFCADAASSSAYADTTIEKNLRRAATALFAQLLRSRAVLTYAQNKTRGIGRCALDLANRLI
jgi:hypothetical protein